VETPQMSNNDLGISIDRKGPTGPSGTGPSSTGGNGNMSNMSSSRFYEEPEEERQPEKDDQLGIDLLANEAKKNEPEEYSSPSESEEDDSSEDQDQEDYDRLFSEQQPGGDHGPYEREKSYEEIQEEKAYCLSQLKRLEKKGIVSPRRFGMESSLNDMKFELKRLKKEVQVDRSINFCRNGLLFFVKAIELVNSRYDPFDLKLEGWSRHMMMELDSYDDVFEELYEKYHTKFTMMPELKLISMVAASAFSFYLQKMLVEKMSSDTTGNGLANVINKLTNLGKGNHNNAGASTFTSTSTSTPMSEKPPASPRNPLQRNMRGPSVSTEELMNRLNIPTNRPVIDSSSDEEESEHEGVKTISIPAPPKKPRGRPRRK